MWRHDVCLAGVMPDKVDPGDNVVACITIENTANYAQTWPVEFMNNTGNESDLLQTGVDLKDLAGFKVPVQVNFTVYANGHPYVVTSNGTILGLGYTVTQYVTIDIDKTSITEHIITSVGVGIISGIIAGVAADEIIESTEIGATIGSAIPGGGTLVGAVAGFVVGVIAAEITYNGFKLP